MKIRKLFIVATAYVVALTISCIKKDVDPDLTGVAAKLQGKWMITGYINDMGQDEYQSMPGCEKDNIITYEKYTVSVNEGSFKCDATDPQSFSSTFTLNGNGVDLLTYTGNEGDDLDEMKIVYLDETTLKLKDAISNLTITYTKQSDSKLFHTYLVGKWKMTGYIKNGVDVWNLAPGTCLKGTDGVCTASIPYCVRDDINTFTVVDNYLADEGLTKCSPTDPQTTKGTYLIENNKHQLTIYLGGQAVVYNLVVLNSTTMVIHEVGTATNDYEMYSRL
ncbi:lipocalin family protein [Pedobacter sp. Leaf170]|uniref:lipocalin family protein n=1 Tax=Pedobacter sp. Leaf170 TaxID=2876558 RepID=UPI001E40AE0F|nr:lipocalin family protein [Pedobacter sp. Leaf170]